MIIVYTEDKNEIDRVLRGFPWWETFRKSKFCVIAKENEKVVGVCCIRSALNIFPTYVIKEYRGLGIAKMLIGNTIIIAGKKNYSFLIGTVGWEKDPNIPMRKVVRKLRFRKVVDCGNETLIIWPFKEQWVSLC